MVNLREKKVKNFLNRAHDRKFQTLVIITQRSSQILCIFIFVHGNDSTIVKKV